MYLLLNRQLHALFLVSERTALLFLEKDSSKVFRRFGNKYVPAYLCFQHFRCIKKIQGFDQKIKRKGDFYKWEQQKRKK